MEILLDLSDLCDLSVIDLAGKVLLAEKLRLSGFLDPKVMPDK